MLRNLLTLKGNTIAAVDGALGSIDDIYFDDATWGVRYLVVDTGSWLDRSQVLISPHSIRHSDPGANAVSVDLSRDQVKNSPSIDTQKPVSRQHEIDYLNYYGYPSYWVGQDDWGMGGSPVLGLVMTGESVGGVAPQPARKADDDPGKTHLRSANVVTGYDIHASDGQMGQVSGFMFDDESWIIRYLAVDTRKWLPGGKTVLLATAWIKSIDWETSAIITDLSREAIDNSPAYEPGVPVSREFEASLHALHGKDGYWARSP